VVKCLFCKRKTLSSNPSSTHTQKKKKKEEEEERNLKASTFTCLEGHFHLKKSKLAFWKAMYCTVTNSLPTDKNKIDLP
jgi:hypothetical protein